MSRASGGSAPNFFVIGAQKSGTSTLHRLLQQHPQAFLCDPKEPHFFSDPRAWRNGPEWYASLFRGAGRAVAVGEASTTYAMYPHYAGVVDRLTSIVAEPRLIYLLREPVARIRSAYLHALALGAETRPMDAALRRDPRYLLTSCYAMQLEQWLRRVPRERILLLSLDELRDAPDALLERTLRFLGLDPAWRPPGGYPTANPGAAKRAPRRWWRAVGEATIRLEASHRVPGWAVRLNASASPLVRRSVPERELAVTGEVRHELLRALRADRSRLARLWDDGSCPTWLQDE
jgi:hypothetical protein